MKNLLIAAAFVGLATGCASQHEQQTTLIAQQHEIEDTHFEHNTAMFHKAAGFYCSDGKAQSFATTKRHIWLTCKDGSRHTIGIESL